MATQGTEASVKSTTVISIKHPTPAWATNVFRTVLIMGPVFNTILSQAPGITDTAKLHISYWTSALITVTWAFSRMIGVKIEDTNKIEDK